MTEFICCYCQCTIFKADTEKQAQCPECGNKTPTEELSRWKERTGKTPDLGHVGQPRISFYLDTIPQQYMEHSSANQPFQHTGETA